MTEAAETCQTCRHHSLLKRPKVVGEAGYDGYVEFADEDESVYACRKVGGPFNGSEFTTPIHCSAYEPGKKVAPPVDEALLRAQARWAKKDER